MLPENFSKALLATAKNDHPLPNMKVRAMANLEHALGEMTNGGAAAGAAGNTALTASKTLAMVKVGVAAAAIAGAIGVGGGYELGRSNSAPPSPAPITRASETNGGTPPSPFAPASPHAASMVSPEAATESSPADACFSAPEVSARKCSSEKEGQTVTFAVTSHCTDATLDLFWVDASCHEVFRGILSPGQTLWQDSWDTHVFRLRDHATHKLVKELAPSPLSTARDRSSYWKGPPTELPMVTLHEGDVAIPEMRPLECTRGGGRGAVLHVKNDRKTPVAIMQIDTDCKETGWGRPPRIIPPGQSFDTNTSEGHAFRVRDSSGGLLVDIAPTMLDTTTYLTFP